MLNLNKSGIVFGTPEHSEYVDNRRKAQQMIKAVVEAVKADRFDRTPEETAARLIDEMGHDEATEAVALLINTVGDWDGRISSVNRAWASGLAADRETLSLAGIYQPGDIHPAHIDQIGDAMRTAPAPVEPLPEEVEAAWEEAVVEEWEEATAEAMHTDAVVLIDNVTEWDGTPAEAEAIRDGLQSGVCYDHAGKMAGIPSESTSPSDNRWCALRAKDPRTICHECYAAALEAMRAGLAAKLHRMTALLTVAAYPVDMQPVFPAGPARFESFGDVGNVNQAVNYVRTARRNPWTQFAAWTKNPWIWNRAFQYDGGKPSNLIMIVSSPVKGQRLPQAVIDRFPWIDRVFTVWETVAAASAAGVVITCGGRSCKRCRRCYTPTGGAVDFVDEVLKVPGNAPEGYHHDADGYHGYGIDADGRNVAGVHVVHNTTGANRGLKWVRYFDGDHAGRREYFKTAAAALAAPSAWV